MMPKVWSSTGPRSIWGSIAREPTWAGIGPAGY
jgi:hypothetical protein